MSHCISIAAVLRNAPDLEFASIMVQTLNLILLTAIELGELRQILRTSFQPAANAEDRDVFTALFNCWCHNPVATLSLCLLCQGYDLGSVLVQKFAEVEITTGLLMQIDKLVQLLESPIFVQLRLQLLEVDAPFHASLLKSLYGLLMLLPQVSTIFVEHAIFTPPTECSLISRVRPSEHLRIGLRQYLRFNSISGISLVVSSLHVA